MFAELNGTIRELEEMSKHLQEECAQKMARIEELELERESTQAEFEHFRAEKEEHARSQESAFQRKLESVTEELEFIRRQHAYDIEMIKN